MWSPARKPSLTLDRVTRPAAAHSLFVVLVGLEVVDEAGQQVDLGQVEEGVVHIDPLLIELPREGQNFRFIVTRIMTGLRIK
jgi:hypothetical protein